MAIHVAAGAAPCISTKVSVCNTTFSSENAFADCTIKPAGRTALLQHSKLEKVRRRLCHQCGFSGSGDFGAGFVKHPESNRHKRFEPPRSSMEATTTVKQNREWGKLEQPDWSGDSLLSKVINTLIGIKPLYSLMKAGARQIMIRSVSSFWLSGFNRDDLLFGGKFRDLIHLVFWGSYCKAQNGVSDCLHACLFCVPDKKCYSKTHSQLD